MKKLYSKPASQSISLLFGSDVADDQVIVGSKGGSGHFSNRRRNDWSDDFDEEELGEE